MTLHNDVARCPGVTDQSDSLPIRLCSTCARWQSHGAGGERIPYMQPPAVMMIYDDHVKVQCLARIGG